MTRSELIAGLMWVTRDGRFREPDDIYPRKVVAVALPSSEYTNEELAKLLAFSDNYTASYDALFGEKSHDGFCNFISFAKTNNRWMRRRRTWRFSSYSYTLDEALAAFPMLPPPRKKA